MITPELIALGTTTEGDSYDTGLTIRGFKVMACPPHHYRHYTTLFLRLPESFSNEITCADFCGAPYFSLGFIRPDGVRKSTYSGWRTREEAEAALVRHPTATLGTQFEVGIRDGRPWGTTWEEPAERGGFAPLHFKLTEEEAAPVIAFRKEMDAAWNDRSTAWQTAEARATEAEAHSAALDGLSNSTLHHLHGPLECLECGATYAEPGHVEPGGMACDRCG